jgi:hypothetical protein
VPAGKDSEAGLVHGLILPGAGIEGTGSQMCRAGRTVYAARRKGGNRYAHEAGWAAVFAVPQHQPDRKPLIRLGRLGFGPDVANLEAWNNR